jgi:hypothetical protein
MTALWQLSLHALATIRKTAHCLFALFHSRLLELTHCCCHVKLSIRKTLAKNARQATTTTQQIPAPSPPQKTYGIIPRLANSSDGIYPSSDRVLPLPDREVWDPSLSLFACSHLGQRCVASRSRDQSLKSHTADTLPTLLLSG